MDLLIIAFLFIGFGAMYLLILWYCFPIIAGMIAHAINQMLAFHHATVDGITHILWAGILLSLVCGWPRIFMGWSRD